MSDLARNLHPKQFIRIHRSFIVNLEAITKIRHHPRYGYQVELRGGRQLQIGTKYLDRIRAAGILEIEDRSRSKVN